MSLPLQRSRLPAAGCVETLWSTGRAAPPCRPVPNTRPVTLDARFVCDRPVADLDAGHVLALFVLPSCLGPDEPLIFPKPQPGVRITNTAHLTQTTGPGPGPGQAFRRLPRCHLRRQLFYR